VNICEGLVAIVTGGSKGIGRAVAIGLAEAGAAVVVVARTPGPIADVVEEIRVKGARAIGRVADVSDEQKVQEVISATLSEFGRVDILVNNAGSAMNPGRSERMSTHSWDETIRVNLTSAFFCAKAVSEAMFAGSGGSIVMVSSTSAIRGFPRTAAYSAAKAGMMGLTRALAAEWADRQVRVNCVCLGAFATDRTADTRSRPDRGIAAHILQRTPQHRYADPREAVSSVLYLASPASSFTTGSILVVDGGFSAV
jgi:NAD(P)-dependent dehydrogenase (short-subunit alcohol dehydrogenase family)